MKRRELERHLALHGCEMLREGTNHTIWHNPPADLRTPVPRHREIPTGTARAICRQLAIPPPAEHADEPRELTPQGNLYRSP